MKSLRSKLPLLFALAALFVTMRAAVRQRRLLRALGATMLTYPGEGIVSGAWDAITNAGGQLKDWVLGALKAAIDPIWSFFDTIQDYINELWQFAGNVYDTILDLRWKVIPALTDAFNWLVQGAKDFAQGIVDASVSFVVGIISTVRDALYAAISAAADAASSALSGAVDFVISVVSNVRDGIIAVVSDIRDALQAAIGAAVDFVIGVISAVRDGIIAVVSEVRDAIMAIISTVWDAIQAVVSTAVDAAEALIQPVWDFLYDHVIGPLEDLSSYVWEHVQPLLDVVTDVLDWLVWLARFPFVAAHDIWDAITGISPRAMMDTMSDATDRVKGKVLAPVRDGFLP